VVDGGVVIGPQLRHILGRMLANSRQIDESNQDEVEDEDARENEDDNDDSEEDEDQQVPSSNNTISLRMRSSWLTHNYRLHLNKNVRSFSSTSSPSCRLPMGRPLPPKTPISWRGYVLVPYAERISL
jgi:hypothetical protein